MKRRFVPTAVVTHLLVSIMEEFEKVIVTHMLHGIAKRQLASK
jgi:hypothetical protein